MIAFPKVKDASDLMCETPNVVDEAQLEELGIAIREQYLLHILLYMDIQKKQLLK